MPHPILQDLEAFRGTAIEHVEDCGGGQWHLRTLGRGPQSLLLLPGALGTADVFCRTALALQDVACVVTVTPPAWDDVVHMADALQALMDRLKMPTAHLVGSSISGYLLQVFALRHAHRVATLVLANTFADASALQRRLPDADTLAGLPAEQAMRELPPRLVPDALRRPPDPAVAAMLGALVGSAQTAQTLQARLLMLARARPVPAVDLDPSSIILVDADDDPVVPDEARAQLRQRYAGSPHHALAGGGHYPMVLQPQAYADVLRRRLETAPVPQQPLA